MGITRKPNLIGLRLISQYKQRFNVLFPSKTLSETDALLLVGLRQKITLGLLKKFMSSIVRLSNIKFWVLYSM